MTDLIERLRDREFFSRTGERHELLAAADRIEALEAALRNTGVCMTCVNGWPDPYGCSDCLNTGWEGGAPAGFIAEKPAADRIEALEAALNDIIIRADDYDEAEAIARAALEQDK